MKLAERHIFRLSKITVFKVFLGFFFAKERPVLTALKKMILDEIKQSSGKKNPKKLTFS